MTLSNAIKLLVAFTIFAIPTSASAQGALETPEAASHASGIGLVRGWHCDALTVEVQFDSGPLYQAAYGTNRPDTSGVCGDANNGFSILVNFNELGDGQHTVQVYADGVQFGNATFQVTTLGVAYLQGLVASSFTDLLTHGQRVRLQWDESMQNFLISSVETLPISPGDVMPLILRSWAGTWVSPDGTSSGILSFSVGLDATATMFQVTGLTLTGTPCADAMTSSPPGHPNQPIAEFLVTFTDGSTALFQGITPFSFTAMTGVFTYASGPCAGQEGVFQAF